MLNIIKASAGSGKTFNLTLEYISLLLSDGTEQNGDGVSQRLYKGFTRKNYRPREYHRHILAITFTNKATNEMKQRIIQELAQLSGLKKDEGKSPYLDILCERFIASPEEIRSAAENVLTELLFDYTNFNVSTIDSFFQMILRTFAAEVNVPYSYEVELSDELVMYEGVRRFLNKVSANPKQNRQALSWLRKFVRDQIQADKDWNPFDISSAKKDPNKRNSRGLYSLVENINKEFFRQVHVAMNQYLADADGDTESEAIGDERKISLFQKKLNEKIKSAKDMVEAAMEKMNNLINPEYGEFRKKNGGFLYWVTKAVDTNFKDCGKLYAGLKNYEGQDLSQNLNLKKLPKNIAEPSVSLCAEFEKLKAPILNGINILMVTQLIVENVYQLGLLGYIAKSVSEFRHENNIIQLSDTTQLLSDIINTSDTPFIYERIGVTILHFLIDEFQDTSAMQWKDLQPLLSQSLSNGCENLIIGDEKQSIYRFRNSDPSLLRTKVEEIFKNYIRPSDTRSRNWRSTPNIIKFNNTLFSRLAEMTGLSEEYSNVIQLTNKKDRDVSGYVNITILNSDDMKTVEARIPKLIYEMLGRGYKQEDIAILVNKNDEGAKVINEILQSNKTKPDNLEELKVVSNESLLLKNSPAIRLILSHLRYVSLLNPLGKDKAKTEKNRALNERLHRTLRQYERLINADMEPGTALRECFGAPDDPSQIINDVRGFMPKDSESYSLVTIIEKIIDKVLSDDAKHDENAYIQAFQDLVVEYSCRYSTSIQSFLRWWDDGKNAFSVSSPSGTDAINVITIHKSKGLEFPCVIIPRATWSIGKMDSILWVTREDICNVGLIDQDDKELVPPLTPVTAKTELGSTVLRDAYEKVLRESISDCMNKTYVAFTRAVDELHIFTKESKGSDKKNDDSLALHDLSYYLNRYVNEPQQELKDATNNSFAEKYGDESADIALALSEYVADSHDENEEDSYEACYIAGAKGRNDRLQDESETQDRNVMDDYKVVDRRVSAKFKTTDIYITERQEEGTMLHKVLSYVHSKDDIDKAISCCRAKAIIPEEKSEYVRQEIGAMIRQNDEVESWFSPDNKVYNERTITKNEVNFRPDRIIVTPKGETIVIDYKFGELHSKKYVEQVHRYMDLLKETGFRNITGKIWYVRESRILNVPI